MQHLQMTRPQSNGAKTIKVIMTFLGAAVFVGVFFSLLVTRPYYRHLWFIKREWWTFPTWKYWLTAVNSLVTALVLAYLISLRQGWLSAPNSAWYHKLVALLLLTAMFPSLTWLVEYGPAFGFYFRSHHSSNARIVGVVGPNASVG